MGVLTPLQSPEGLQYRRASSSGARESPKAEKPKGSAT